MLAHQGSGARSMYSVEAIRSALRDRGTDLYTQFAYADDPPRVVIDLSDSHVWDASTVAALDAVETKYAARGTALEIVGLNAASAAMHERLSGQLG